MFTITYNDSEIIFILPTILIYKFLGCEYVITNNKLNLQCLEMYNNYKTDHSAF